MASPTRVEQGIRKTGSGKYQALYRDPAGKLRSKNFDRLADARRFRDGIRVEVQRHSYVDPRLGRMTLGDYAATWAETKANVGARTRINVEGRLRNHILPAFRHRPLGSIQAADVRAWLTSLTLQGLAPSTVKATYLSFGQIMRTAEIDGLIHRSPCIGIELPAESSHEEMHFLSVEQVAALAGAIEPRYRCAILTAAYTGLRAGELWALKVSRVNLLKRTLDVVESLSEVRGKVVTGPTKTKTRRTVTLPSFVADVIGQHIGRYPSEDGYVFTGAKGGPVRHRNLMARHFHRAVKDAGLPDTLRFHDLRHTCAAILIAQGWAAKQIQDRLGHASIRTTLDRYGHLFEGHDAALLDRLDGLLRATEASHVDSVLTLPSKVAALDAKQGAKKAP